MEPKFCPLLSIDQPANQPCERCHCAFWVELSDIKGGCAVAVLAEGMKEAVNELSYISANMP